MVDAARHGRPQRACDRVALVRLLAAVPVKNEASMLPTTLGTLQEVVDVIIVADQQSTDATAEICARFPKVVRIENSSPNLDDGNHYQLLLDAARSYEGDNIILALDADEILTGSALDQDIIGRLCDTLQPGSSAELPYFNLWKSVSSYRADGPKWGQIWWHCVYRDDRQGKVDDGRMHRNRVPPSSRANVVRLEEPKIMHFAYVFWDRVMAKHRWYRMLERIYFPAKDVLTINATYIQHVKDQQSAQVEAVPEAWIAPWQARGVPLPQAPDEQISWHEIECLKLFQAYGLDHFAGLDIWDVNWEERRRRAIAAGHQGIPEQPIIDPRSSRQRFEQAFIRRFYHRPPYVIAWSRLKTLTRAAAH